MKKLFSFIHGETAHVAPSTKVLPAEEFSTLKTAKELLDHAVSDAEQYKKEVVSEIEKLKEIAQREGFEEGFKKWTEQIAMLEEEVKKVRQDMEKMVLPIALKAAQKIVSKELELSQNAIVDIVTANLKAVSQHKQVAIYVNKAELNALETARPKLKDLFEGLESLSIRERADIQPGGCVIETEGGIINAQIENRWRILENAFEKMKKG